MLSKQTSTWNTPSLRVTDHWMCCSTPMIPSSLQAVQRAVNNCWWRWRKPPVVWYEVPKCHSLGMQTSSRKRYDPKPQLIGENIPFIANKTLKFLGGQIRVLQSCKEHKQYLSDKLSQLLDKVNKTPVTRKQKFLLYKVGICPRLNWDPSILELPFSWVSSTLEAKATHYLKRWSGSARSADSLHLYLPKNNEGLQLPPISLL